MLSLNLHRRHLSSGERSAVALRMLPRLEAEAKKRKAHGATAPSRTLTQKVEETSGSGRSEREATTQAARLTGTNRQYVHDAKKLAEQALQMLERVERVEVTIPQAKRELGWEKPKEGSPRP